jgi:hypothetical protein
MIPSYLVLRTPPSCFAHLATYRHQPAARRWAPIKSEQEISMKLMLMAAVSFLAITAGPARAQANDGPVTVVVAVPTPPSVERAKIEAGIKASVPRYQKMPGLLKKYFTIGEGTFGGVYLFETRAAAQAAFSDAWKAQIVTTYGAAPSVTYFDVPLVLDNAAVSASYTVK